MRYLRLALKNLLRRPMRSALTIAGVALAVAAAVSLAGFNLGYKQAIERSMDKLGFQLMIMAKGCPYEAATMMLKGGTGLLYMPADTVERVRSDPNLQALTPIFIGLAQKEGSGIREDSTSSFLIFAGIDVPSYLVMKPWLKFEGGAGYEGGRWFAPGSEEEVVLGYEAATYEQRKVGDKFFASIVPKGKTGPEQHRFKVVGVLERTGTQDDGTVFLPLAAGQKFFNRPDELTILGLKLKEFNATSIREFESRWMKLPEVQVVSLQQVKNTLVMLIGTAQTMVLAVAVIAVVVAVLGVVNTILMSVYERTGEIGIMKAIGADRSDIFQLIWLETLAVCSAGGLAGGILAWAGAGAMEAALKALLDLGVQGSIVSISWRILAGALGGALLVGFFAGLYPAWRAAGMQPIEAIRQGE